MIKYKTDIMRALAAAGYNSRRLRAECLLGESTMSRLRAGEVISLTNLGTICALLDCQPGDLIEYVPDTPDAHDARE